MKDIPAASGGLHLYPKNPNLHVEVLGRGHTWRYTGTQESLREASQFVRSIEHHQGFRVACLEEIAYRNGWMNAAELQPAVHGLGKTSFAVLFLRLSPSSFRSQVSGLRSQAFPSSPLLPHAHHPPALRRSIRAHRRGYSNLAVLRRDAGGAHRFRLQHLRTSLH